MPMPLWWGQINKRVFNPRALKSGTRPILRHVGRSLGNTFRTPLDAFSVDGGYVFSLVYGSQSDWVQNIMASTTATLENVGDEIALTNPRIIARDEAANLVPAATQAAPKWLNVNEFLRMDVS